MNDFETIDTNHVTDALAKILYELIDINEGGNDLADAAREVEMFFRRADFDFWNRVLEKLEEERIDFDYDTTHGMYRALLKISKLKVPDSIACYDNLVTAIEIAKAAMRKAHGESEVSK
jgi:hypothetical protein